MQGSKADNFVKSAKRSKSFDDGYSGRKGGKKNDYHRVSRSNGNKAEKSPQQS